MRINPGKDRLTVELVEFSCDVKLPGQASSRFLSALFQLLISIFNVFHDFFNVVSDNQTLANHSHYSEGTSSASMNEW
jgi:hypothetical protein